ncbi:MAG: glycosyltransferase family 39 protein [Acidobacteriota bacterium]|nr:glycosyltransferase family 39 protein [Acidobacteriota bacterium]
MIFLVAFGVRFLCWQDTRRDAVKVQSGVVNDYQHTGRLLRAARVRGFFNRSGSLADPGLLGHPPGYPIVLAIVGAVFGESDTAVQLVNVTFDALAAVLIFLIAIELLPFACGVIAGLLVALAPQFVWNSVLLLPDTLAVVPLLVAIYFLTRAVKRPHLIIVLAAGVFVGLSCWLRANALLMAPFLALVVLLLFERKRRLRYAGALLAGAILVVAPLTLRNWIVFEHFIPVSLGAGQTMLEGISDYDPERRFGIPNTDMGIMKMEAEEAGRPDYYSTLFAPDGIKRERMRLARGFRIVRENPAWFASVMLRRAGSMLRLERARLISPNPPVSHRLEVDESQRIWLGTPADLLAGAAEKSPGAQLVAAPDGKTTQVVSDSSTYGLQFKTSPIPIKKQYDYLVRLPMVVEEGRMAVNVAGSKTGKVYGSANVEKAEVKEVEPQPLQIVEVPFVSGRDQFVSLVFNNAAPPTGRSVAYVGNAELFELGPAASLWTRYPRMLISGIQKLFITAVMLPLALLGIFILVRRRAWPTLVLLLSVPAYYLCFQSMLHTEYRYVLAIHYFLFVLVAIALYKIATWVLRQVKSRLPKPIEAS